MAEAGERFIAAFNEIENHFRSILSVDEHVEFAEMARDYVASKHLPREHRDALSAFARLRNAISHERYRDGRPVADPRPDVVEQIERLRDLFLKPPTALKVLGQMDVRRADLDTPISAVLENVRLFDYSQFPVYDRGGYVGILTTNAIARWLAAQLAKTGGLAEVESVRLVLKFAESHERALHVPRTITAAEAIHRLSRGGPAGRPVTALIITHSGKATEQPLAMVVDDDLPRLVEALAL